MWLNVLSAVFFFAAVAAALYMWLAPTRGGWDSLSDAIYRFAAVGAFSMLACVTGVIGLDMQSPWRYWIIAIIAITALPAAAALVFFVLIGLKLR